MQNKYDLMIQLLGRKGKPSLCIVYYHCMLNVYIFTTDLSRTSNNSGVKFQVTFPFHYLGEMFFILHSLLNLHFFLACVCFFQYVNRTCLNVIRPNAVALTEEMINDCSVGYSEVIFITCVLYLSLS